MSVTDSEFKEVLFNIYCDKCKHRDKKDYEDPCNECLEVGMREGTHIPEKWEGKNA